jgi:hypothetical protein
MNPDKWIEVALKALVDHPGWLSFTVIALYFIHRYKDVISAHTERSTTMSKTAETIRQKQIRFDEGVEARRRKQLPPSRGPRTDK